MSRLFIKPRLLKGKAGESCSKSLEVASVQVRNQERNPGYNQASGNSAFNFHGFHLHVVWTTPVNIYPCPCLLLFPQETSLQFILSVRIHSVQQKSPQTAETQLLQQGITFSTPCESEWQPVSQCSASIHEHLHHLYPALHLSASLRWLSEQSPASPLWQWRAVIPSLLTACLTWACSKNIMGNAAPPAQLHCCCPTWDKPWR